MSDEQRRDVVVSEPEDRFLVKLDNGGWRLMRRDANGSAYQEIPEAVAMELRASGLPTKLERAELTYQEGLRTARERGHALAETLRSRGFTPSNLQGPLRLQQNGQTTDGEPSYMGYALDMAGNERRGPLTAEEARYLSASQPEGVDLVPEGEALVPEAFPPQHPSAAHDRAWALVEAMRRGR